MTTEPSPLGAEQLTEALRRSGVLGDACVRDVAVVSSRPTVLSRITRLRLTYDRAVPAAPATLILKSGLPERLGGRSGEREVAFYSRVVSDRTRRLVPTCYDAAWNAETRAWHLLLEDLADSHLTPSTWPLPPTEARCRDILTAWARLHAVWWDDPRLGASLGVRHTETTTAAYTRDCEACFAPFADRLGDDLSPARREVYERLLAAVPKLLARHCSHRDMTIIHGDAHVWNAFLPKEGGDDVRVFDWDSWRVSLASSDLAYMMALHWFPDRRRRLETALLDHYHRALLSHGVRGYGRDALTADYRLSALLQIMTPVFQAAYKIPPAIWWNHLDRIMRAVDDLGCRDLL